MTKFRLILSGVIALSLLTTFYLFFVYGATINWIYLGPNTEYPNRWTGGLLLASMVFALASLMTLYFTFFELYEDEDGRLRFKNPDSFLLKFALKDKLTKPVSSCSLFWDVVWRSGFLFASIMIPVYFISAISNIKHEGWAFESFASLVVSIWLLASIFNELFGKFKLISKLSSSPWFNGMWLAFLGVALVVAIVSNPMVVIYMLLIFLGMGAIVFVSVWLGGKSSTSSLFRRDVESSKEGHCPIIYPKDNGENDGSRAAR